MIGLSRFALVAAVLGMTSTAFALPKYAQKEKKACAFCHVSPQGAGKRTTAGEWYKAHNHTLAGFKEPAAKPKPGAPTPKKK